MPVNSELLAQRFGLDEQVAIVTGGAVGIGRATAQLFCEAGAKVVIADIDSNSAELAVKTLRDEGHEATAITFDQRDEASVISMIAASIERYQQIDILVNNAGVFPVDPILDTTVERWDEVQSINLRGPFLCMRETLKHMRHAGRGGRVINISSAASVLPTLYDEIPYNASKAGLNMLTQASAMEFAKDAITINGVIPAFVVTEGAIDSAKNGPKRHGPAMNTDRRLLGRLGEPQEIANAILFLASPAAAYITGHLLHADGGFAIS